MTPRLAVLMPAYNERTRLLPTLASLRDTGERAADVTVFLVDDGSDPPLDPAELPSPTPAFRLVVARHAINLGQGAALETARALALREAPFDAYVTMDADGQHRASDAFALARAIKGGADVAFGNRFGESEVPRARRLVLGGARLFEWALTGLRLADAHNGLRAFSRAALERIAIRQNRMAHATEITQLVSRASALVVVEVPVRVTYSEETLAKGQRSLGAVDIVHDLAVQYLFGEPET